MVANQLELILMKYDLEFHPSAMKEWKKLDSNTKEQFRKVLKRRLIEPQVVSARLHNPLNNCYKIKLRQSGYRLIYEVKDAELIVMVISVGKRNKSLAYEKATSRLN